MSVEERAKAVMPTWLDADRDAALRTRSNGALVSVDYRLRIAKEINEAVTAAISASESREKALREELGRLNVALADVISVREEAFREADRHGRGCNERLPDFINHIASKLTSALAEFDVQRIRGDTWRERAEVLSDQLAAARAEVVEWQQKYVRQGLASPPIILTSAPRESSRSPEWIAAAEACIGYVRIRFPWEIDGGMDYHAHPAVRAAIAAVASLDAQTASPAREEEAAIAAGLKVLSETNADGANAIRLRNLYRAGLLREGAGK